MKKALLVRRRAKYGNTPTAGSASKREARRLAELRLLESAGRIFNLKTQVPFLLVPEQRDANGKLVERPVRYIADFAYYESDPRQSTIDIRCPPGFVVEDAKGFRTPDYVIKRKLMLWLYGIKVIEV